jgi:hypothetical protein
LKASILEAKLQGQAINNKLGDSSKVFPLLFVEEVANRGRRRKEEAREREREGEGRGEGEGREGREGEGGKERKAKTYLIF